MIKSLSKLFAAAFGQAGRTENVFHPADKCSECGTPLMRVSRGWDCPNLDCPAQIRVRIEHWCSADAMDIPGGSRALVALLVEHGLVRDVAELYRLKVAEIAALPGMDKQSAQKFFDALVSSRKNDAWRLLFGLSIADVSANDARALCGHFGSVDNVFAASVDRLKKVDGINETSARNIVHWHSDSVNRRLARRLFKAGLNFKVEK
jgi:DNA ligase (NAD+)